MSKEFYVSSVSEYQQTCAHLGNAGNTYFRGQTVEYPKVLPSLFRNGAIFNGQFEELIGKLYISCYGLGEPSEIRKAYEDAAGQTWPDPIQFPNIFPPDAEFGFNIEKVGPGQRFGQSWFNYVPEDALVLIKDSFQEHWGNHSDALLQHYGVPSRGLDMTSDPLVALWFATNAFQRQPDGTAVFVPSGGGTRIVYIFQDLNAADVVNLQATASFAQIGYPEFADIPYYGQRGVAQKGLLFLGATKEEPDLKKYVTASIHLEPGDWATASLTAQGYQYRRLIPPPDVDGFYRELLKERQKAGSQFKALVDHIIEYV